MHFCYLREQRWPSGKALGFRTRGPGFDSRPCHLNFQRLVISCFQVAIWLKKRRKSAIQSTNHFVIYQICSHCKHNVLQEKIHSNRSQMMIKKDISRAQNYSFWMIFSTDNADYWCGIVKVIRGLSCKLYRNTKIMHHIVAYYRINIHIYSEIVIFQNVSFSIKIRRANSLKTIYKCRNLTRLCMLYKDFQAEKLSFLFLAGSAVCRMLNCIYIYM